MQSGCSTGSQTSARPTKMQSRLGEGGDMPGADVDFGELHSTNELQGQEFCLLAALACEKSL